jgi:hypothetical protein
MTGPQIAAILMPFAAVAMCAIMALIVRAQSPRKRRH